MVMGESWVGELCRGVCCFVPGFSDWIVRERTGRDMCEEARIWHISSAK